MFDRCERRSVFPVAPGAITGGAEVRPSVDCEVCNVEQPPKSGSATMARDWATRRSPSWDSKMEIPVCIDVNITSGQTLSTR